jgi:hypothetical protein
MWEAYYTTKQKYHSLKALHVHEEGFYKLTVDCARLLAREDRYRNIAIYWNKFKDWKQKCL